jgi:hypothetical protein
MPEFIEVFWLFQDREDLLFAKTNRNKKSEDAKFIRILRHLRMRRCY